MAQLIALECVAPEMATRCVSESSASWCHADNRVAEEPRRASWCMTEGVAIWRPAEG